MKNNGTLNSKEIWQDFRSADALICIYILRLKLSLHKLINIPVSLQLRVLV